MHFKSTFRQKIVLEPAGFDKNTDKNGENNKGNTNTHNHGALSAAAAACTHLASHDVRSIFAFVRFSFPKQPVWVAVVVVRVTLIVDVQKGGIDMSGWSGGGWSGGGDGRDGMP
jgi:hypothetical protein